LNTTNTSPDVVVSLRWSEEKNQYGAPGLVVSEGGKKGEGTHASLSRFDMRNTLVASGPDFRRGYIDELPSGNADVVPTILWLLGVKPARAMDGRILVEALNGPHDLSQKPETKTIEAHRRLELNLWRQYLKFTTLDEQIYFDEGNGESVPN